MSEISASLTINLVERKPDEQAADAVFNLQVAEDEPSTPIHAAMLFDHDPPMNYATAYPNLVGNRLKVEGIKTVQLFCSAATFQAGIRLMVFSGSATFLGRKTIHLVQDLTWTGGRSCVLSHPYDRPEVTVVAASNFYNLAGVQVGQPVYNRTMGAFVHREEVIGSLIVAYDTTGYLYRIAYDLGKSGLTTEQFQAIRTAWIRGEANGSSLPPVQVIAQSSRHVAHVSLARELSPPTAGDVPNKSPDFMRRWILGSLHQDEFYMSCDELLAEKQEIDEETRRQNERDEQFRERQLMSDLTREEQLNLMIQLRQCEEKKQTRQLVEQSRESKTVRIVDPNYPSSYIDVARDTKVRFVDPKTGEVTTMQLKSD